MTSILIEKNISVPMRDGVCLSANIYRLQDAGPLPVLLIRTPYDKESIGNGDGTIDLQRAVQAGYVLVVEDTRGRFASQGEFNAIVQEHQDGADTIAWAATQPWSSGAVGMVGGSYVGNVQWLAASQQPPALRAIAPLVTFTSPYEAFSLGGIPLLLSRIWSAAMAVEEIRRQVLDGRLPPQGTVLPMPPISEIEGHLPLCDFPWMQGLADYYFEWQAHPALDSLWDAMWSDDDYARVIVPALNLGGWYDCFLQQTIDNYRRMRRQGGSAQARAGQRLVIGPWSHGNFSGIFPEREFGPAASVQACDLHGQQLRWFDHWLKGSVNGLESDKPVKIFVMGINQWREEEDWPLADARAEPYFLRSNGSANSSFGDGCLSATQPDQENPDIYLDNPHRPVPTRGGQVLLGGPNDMGPRDQRLVERREDVLVYTSAPMNKPTEITGQIELHLFVSSSAPDADFTARLVDLFPDGQAILLTEGALRARYRSSLRHTELMEPGQVYEMEIALWATSNVFLPGHCIRLDISSSSFPRLTRNSHSGGEIAQDGRAECHPAINTVYHDAEHPSRLVLPLIERV